MKRTLTLSILCLLFIGFSSHARGQGLFSLKKNVIENEVDSIFKETLGYAEKLDYDQLSAGVDDRQHAGFIVGGKYYSDYVSLVNVVKAGAQGVSHQRISIDEKKVTALSDNLVLLTASGTSSVTLSDGNQFNMNFYWSFVYQKFGDQWKVIHSHQSRAG